MSTRAFASAAALAAFALSACIMGGSGTDTENGVTARVTDGQGAPLAGVALRLFEPDYRPDLGQAPAEVLANPSASLTSDAQGKVRLELKAAGKFVVEGTSEGKTLFFDTLAVADLKQAATYTFRARASSVYQGKVKLASGMRIDSGWVFIRGTARLSKVDTAGGYDLGPLPADAERMGLGVRFRSSPVAVLRTTNLKGASDLPSYTCNEVPTDSASRVVQSVPTVGGLDSQAKLDSAQVDPALKACGTLASGTVINVTGNKTVTATNPVAQADVNLLVLKGADTTGFTSPKTTQPIVVPLSQCVANLGTESTTFAVDLQAASGGNDLVVGDVAPKCLSP